MLHGNCCSSKASLLKYLGSFLKACSPSVSDKFVALDQVDELFRNLKVCNLFCKYDSNVHWTGADASFQKVLSKELMKSLQQVFALYCLVLVYQFSFSHMLFDMLFVFVIHYPIMDRKNLQLN